MFRKITENKLVVANGEGGRGDVGAGEGVPTIRCETGSRLCIVQNGEGSQYFVMTVSGQ